MTKCCSFHCAIELTWGSNISTVQLTLQLRDIPRNLTLPLAACSSICRQKVTMSKPVSERSHTSHDEWREWDWSRAPWLHVSQLKSCCYVATISLTVTFKIEIVAPTWVVKKNHIPGGSHFQGSGTRLFILMSLMHWSDMIVKRWGRPRWEESYFAKVNRVVHIGYIFFPS